jgi:hypothetical protein
LGSGARALVDSLDVDLHALHALGVGVQVVEVTGQALPEGGSTEGALAGGQSQGVVAAESKALSLKSASLNGSVELEPGIAISMSIPNAQSI